MAILSSIPVLNCQAIEETLAFYQQLLQFVVVNKREEGGVLQWVHLMHGNTPLMLQSAARQRSEPGQNKVKNINLYFFVNNISELNHYVKAKNYGVSEIKETDYHMLEFNLTDPEGNPVTIAQKS